MVYHVGVTAGELRNKTKGNQMLALFTIIGAFAVVATIGATIGTKGRQVDVGCTRLVADEVITLTDAEIYHLLDDTQEIDAITDTQEITALGGF